MIWLVVIIVVLEEIFVRMFFFFIRWCVILIVLFEVICLIWLIKFKFKLLGIKLVLIFWILCGVGLIFFFVSVCVMTGDLAGLIVIERIVLFWVFLM